MITGLIFLLALAVIVTLVGLSGGLWLTSQDLEVERLKEPVAEVRVEGPRGRITRAITDQRGRTITVELVGKDGGDVVLIHKGKQQKYPIDQLSGADQEFINRWQP